jgi:hypothetical protein
MPDHSSPWAPGDYPLTPGYPVRQPRTPRLTAGPRRAAARLAGVLAVLLAVVVLWEAIVTVVLWPSCSGWWRLGSWRPTDARPASVNAIVPWQNDKVAPDYMARLCAGTRRSRPIRGACT